MRFPDFCRAHPEHREEADERAAIMQYDGEMSREEAEKRAVGRMLQKYNLWFSNIEGVSGEKKNKKEIL